MNRFKSFVALTSVMTLLLLSPSLAWAQYGVGYGALPRTGFAYQNYYPQPPLYNQVIQSNYYANPYNPYISPYGAYNAYSLYTAPIYGAYAPAPLISSPFIVPPIGYYSSSSYGYSNYGYSNYRTNNYSTSGYGNNRGGPRGGRIR